MSEEPATLPRDRASSLQYDRDLKEKGRKAAIAAAIAGGARMTQKGRRIRFPVGGGSRLVSTPGTEIDK